MHPPPLTAYVTWHQRFSLALNLNLPWKAKFLPNHAPINRGRVQGRLHQACQLHRMHSHTLLRRPRLSQLQGKNLVHLIVRPDEPYCFRLQKDRVFYVSEASMRLGISVARPNLVSLGTCFGKFSKSGKFKLHITALDYLAQYAKYKVCMGSVPRFSLC